MISRISEEAFSESALVLVGHGTRFDPEAARPVYQHAEALRRRQAFGVVREAFWKQEPRLGDVVAAATCPRVFVAPFFISEGYFCERVVPESLGFKVEAGPDWSRVLERSGQTLFYCKPVGSHPDVVNIVLHRAQEVTARFPFPRAPKPSEVSLFIAGHGTKRDERSRETIERAVARIQAANLYTQVHAVYLEEAPHINACYELARTGNIVLVPFFVSEGPHVKEDIPRELGQSVEVLRQRLERGQSPWCNPTEKHGKRLWYAQPVGTDPRLADVVLERVREAAAWPPLQPGRVAA